MNSCKNVLVSSIRDSEYPSSSLTHVTLSFDNNKHAGALFGKFDEHLAFIENRLGVQAIARGNYVDLSGNAPAVARAQSTLEHLYKKLESGEIVETGDVDGAIRMSANPDTDREKTYMNASQPIESDSGRTRASISIHKKTIYARTPMQSTYIRAMLRNEMIFGVGPAGVGKTYLAVVYAISLLEQGSIDRIILSRPVVEAGEQLGFLPGDVKEKIDPYLRPLYDSLYDAMSGEKVERAIANGLIEIAPLAFMRGRTLANSAIILDEAQNTTTMQMKMFLTRIGENSRMIITGDPSQIDLPKGQKSGLTEALCLLDTMDEIKQIRFSTSDVIRHPLVAKIVEAYDNATPQKKGISFSGNSC